MPYPLRIDVAGETYHVNSKSAFEGVAFRDDHDRSIFLVLLAQEIKRAKWTCLSYTLMGTHFHALIRLNEPTLSSGFQRLIGRYARSFNARHRRRGVLWQRRFYDKLIESDAHLLETTRYIARNATKARLVERPEDWPWCSYGATIGVFPPDPLIDEKAILGLFSNDLATAREEYRRFVEESDPRVRRSQIRLRDGLWTPQRPASTDIASA
jgi:REP element-mobilizing transposase RayT